MVQAGTAHVHVAGLSCDMWVYTVMVYWVSPGLLSRVPPEVPVSCRVREVSCFTSTSGFFIRELHLKVWESSGTSDWMCVGFKWNHHHRNLQMNGLDFGIDPKQISNKGWTRWWWRHVRPCSWHQVQHVFLFLFFLPVFKQVVKQPK